MACIIPDFDLLNAEEINKINSSAKLVRYNSKDIIYKNNTPSSFLMYLKEGMVKVYKTDNHDKTIILEILLRDSFLGIVSVFSGTYHPFSAMAIEDCEIVYIELSIINEILLNNAPYAVKFIEIVSQRGLTNFLRLDSFTRKQLPGRVADVLLFFSENVYKSLKFSFPLTRKELAEFVGTTKESFIRTLSEFKNDKIISLEGKDVIINSIEIVKTLSKLG